MKKYSILSFNFCNYEILREPLEVDPECDYILVTDNKKLTSNYWTIKYLPSELEDCDGFTKSFYVRYHPFEFVNTECCIVIDGSVQINKSLHKLFNDFEKSSADASFMVHFCTLNPFAEYSYWQHSRNVEKIQVEKSKRFLTILGLSPSYKGYFETGFKICKNNKICNEIHEAVYNALKLIGKDEKHIERVDQTIFSGIINVLYSDMKIFPVTRQIIQNSYLTYCDHNTNHPNRVRINFNNLWLFNKRIQVYTLD